YTQFMPSVRHYSQEDVLDFASQVGIAPGIVVGRLQKDKKIQYSHLNGLKLPLSWSGFGNINA
ncbi:MAG: XRE family transcriptional regulator, partial [Anaerolineae bacterium]|nr:XRE family transcriptional regulator [Anaerolineae bacterium]